MNRIGYSLAVLLLSLTAPCRGAETTDGIVSEAILEKSDRYLAELFRQPDESALVDELCERVNNFHDTSDSSSLKKIPPAQKLLWDVWSSKSVIDNGGMEYYLTADFVDFDGRAESFRKLGLAECADLLEQAYAEFPDAKVPDNIDERKKLIERMPEETRDRWNNISSKYFQRSGQLTFLLGDYARKNAEAYVSLRRKVDDAKYAELRKKDISTPAPNAPAHEVVNWLEAIGGGSLDRSSERLNSVWLGKERRSTSDELRSLTAMHVVRDIEELGLDDTKFTDADAKYLLKFPRLRVLHLRNVSVSEPTVDVIERIPSLQVLWITGTEIPYERFRVLLERKQFEEIYYSR